MYGLGDLLTGVECSAEGAAQASRLLLLRNLLVLAAEALDTTCRVHHALLAGIERVALVADVHRKSAASGASNEGRAACAADRRFLVLGVNAFFHDDLY